MYYSFKLKRASMLALAFVLTLTGSLLLAGVFAPRADAADPPIAQRSATGVTADVLPTVQINGVVWDQAVVGNTVYAGGQFTNARPAGSPAGQNQTPRSNLLAYDVTTGNLTTSFAPSLNGTVNVLALSPDKARLYVGGSFTTANGAQRNRIAAYNTATGALITTFAPNLNASVRAITATNTTVYVGGYFSTANGNARTRLAAFNASNGTLTGWAPVADSDVNALLLTPDGSKVIAAGAFGNINSSIARGLGAINSATGALEPWIANTVVKNYGSTAANLSLKTDGTTIYGSGYWFGGTGNFEGVWAADPNTGAIKWLADCHGDTYDEMPINGFVYSVSHHHTCQNIASFPEQSPRQHWRGNAFTAATAGTVRHNSQSGYPDFFGHGAPSQVNWFPQFAAGSFTGQTQAGWTVEGNTDYVVIGGEFPSVNGVAQQGLVRFAVAAKAPKKEGNRISSADSAPTLLAVSGTSVRVSWKTNWDRDDARLTYQVRRSDKGSTPVHTATNVESLWWNRKTLTFFDTGLSPNTSYTYTIRENDGDGNVAFSESRTVTTGSNAAIQDSSYSAAVKGDEPTDYWPVNESAGATTSLDWAGSSDLTLSSGVTLGQAGAINGSDDTAAKFSGTSTGLAATSSPVTGPDTFSVESWIKTTSNSGGKILGFGNARTGNSSSYDRHLYMDNGGRISFGVRPGAVKTVRGTSPYNDGAWHHVVGTLSEAGMVLYVDGAQVAADASVTSAQANSGYWRVGGDNLASWPNAGSSSYLNGTLDDVAIYPTALTAAQVQAHHATGIGAPNADPVAAFSTSCVEGACSFDAAASSDPDGTIASYVWDFGDQTTGTGVAPTHTFAASGTYSVRLTVTDNRGDANSLTKPVTVTVPQPNQPPVSNFTSSCDERACAFDGSGSSDPDGTIASYDWDFGDDSTGSGATPNHTYATDGTYDVQLIVTDNQGASVTLTKQVTAKANVAPTASFTTDCTALKCDVDGSDSSDSDGTIASYAWDFGDGESGTGAVAAHTYAAGATYDIKLTVTDDKGAKDSKTKSVTVAAAGNQPPTAAFTASSTNLTATFDADDSTDVDGTITSYAWEFGDGSNGTGQSRSHTYTGTGIYSVKLTVTDNDGGTDSVNKRVLVGDSPFVEDTFTRTATNSWGSADTGGSWTVSNSSRFSVDGSAGKMRLEAAAVTATGSLNSISRTNFNVVSDISVDKVGTGSGIQVTDIVRKTGTGEYRVTLLFQPGGSLRLSISRIVGGSATTIRDVAVSGVTYSAGDDLRLRVVASGTGTTSLSGKVWKAGSAEPASAQATASDSTASLQTSGSFGVQAYLSGSATNFPVTVKTDDLLVTTD